MIFLKQKSGEEYPEFWKNYLSLFKKNREKRSIDDTRFVALDTETTGFDYQNDRILSIGAIGIKNAVIDVSDQLEIYLKQEVFNAKTVEIHGIRKHADIDQYAEVDALQKFIEYIGNAVLIAHHADFDRKMINKALERQGLGEVKNRFVDTGILFKKTKHLIYVSGTPNKSYSLDELGVDLKIPMSDRHTASGDAFITALAFLKVIAKLKILKTHSVKELFR